MPRDGRYFIFANHVLLVILGYGLFSLQRTIPQLLIGMGAALLTETIAHAVSKKNAGKSLLDRWFSASIAALSLFLIINSPNLWFYGYGSILAILSKYLLRVDNDRHIFNPTGVAIIVLLAILPQSYFRLYGDEFNLNLYLIGQVLVFGILATYVSKRWVMSVSYMSTMLLGAVFFYLASGREFLYFFGPEISANGLLFIWLMMTDPRTTPASSRDQAVIGAAIALINLVLKNHEIVYSQFISLFSVGGIRMLLLAFSNDTRVAKTGAESRAA